MDGPMSCWPTDLFYLGALVIFLAAVSGLLFSLTDYLERKDDDAR